MNRYRERSTRDGRRLLPRDEADALSDSWQTDAIEAGAEGPMRPLPRWSMAGIPWCNPRCPHLAGDRRCSLLSIQAESVCLPVVVGMVALIKGTARPAAPKDPDGEMT